MWTGGLARDALTHDLCGCGHSPAQVHVRPQVCTAGTSVPHASTAVVFSALLFGG